MKTYFTEANGVRTEYKFVSSHTLPTNIPISAPLTFAFIGKNLVLTRKNNGWGNVLGGKLQKGETWKEALKREVLEEAGIIDYISVVPLEMEQRSKSTSFSRRSGRVCRNSLAI